MCLQGESAFAPTGSIAAGETEQRRGKMEIEVRYGLLRTLSVPNAYGRQ